MKRLIFVFCLTLVAAFAMNASATTGPFTEPLTGAILSVDLNGGQSGYTRPTEGWNGSTTAGEFDADAYGVVWSPWAGPDWSGGDNGQLPQNSEPVGQDTVSISKTFTFNGTPSTVIVDNVGTTPIDPPITVTITADGNLSSYKANWPISSRDRDGADTNDGYMFRDFIFGYKSGSNTQGTNYLKVEFSGLTVGGNYMVALYAHDKTSASPDNSVTWTATPPPHQAGYTDAGGFLAPDDVQTITWSGSTALQAPAVFTLTADGDGKVTVWGFGGDGITGHSDSGNTYFNGFQLVPVPEEPEEPPPVVCSQIIDLGTLGGDGSSEAYSVNEKGQIVGYAYSSDGNSYACLFDPTGDANKNINLWTLGTTSDDPYSTVKSKAYSINNSGQIVGFAQNVDDKQHACLFDPTGDANKNIDLGTLGGQSSEARSINNHGQIIGFAMDSEGLRACLFDPTGDANNNINLGTITCCGNFDLAYSINDHGQVVGYGFNNATRTHAGLYDSTGDANNNIDLGTMGGDESSARCINNNGQIVGFARDSNSNFRAAIFDPTGDANNHIDLGTLGGLYSHARSINNKGYIVGDAHTSDGGYRACLFDPTGQGENTNLNDILPPDANWTLWHAYSISDNGWIVGHGIHYEGAYGYIHAGLLILDVVDYPDLKSFAEQWLMSGTGLSADLYPDDMVDFKDFAEFAKYWFEYRPGDWSL